MNHLVWWRITVLRVKRCKPFRPSLLSEFKFIWSLLCISSLSGWIKKRNIIWVLGVDIIELVSLIRIAGLVTKFGKPILNNKFEVADCPFFSIHRSNGVGPNAQSYSQLNFILLCPSHSQSMIFSCFNLNCPPRFLNNL